MQNVSELVRNKVCRIMDVLLSDGPIHIRVADATHLLSGLQQEGHDISSAIISELTEVIDFFIQLLGDQADAGAPLQGTLTAEQEMDLSARLLMLYIDLNEGVLVY